MMRLDVGTFCILFGCLWSFCVFALGVTAMISQKGTRIVELFAQVYVGYAQTLSGCLVGAFWGFLDGIVSGILIAWIYNLLALRIFGLQ